MQAMPVALELARGVTMESIECILPFTMAPCVSLHGTAAHGPSAICHPPVFKTFMLTLLREETMELTGCTPTMATERFGNTVGTVVRGQLTTWVEAAITCTVSISAEEEMMASFVCTVPTVAR